MDNVTSLLENPLFFVDWRWLTTGCICVFSYYLAKFYLNVSRYPKGPFPLPFVGNLRIGKLSNDSASCTLIPSAYCVCNAKILQDEAQAILLLYLCTMQEKNI